jgi:hypothetical protein
MHQQHSGNEKSHLLPLSIKVMGERVVPLTSATTLFFDQCVSCADVGASANIRGDIGLIDAMYSEARSDPSRQDSSFCPCSETVD